MIILKNIPVIKSSVFPSKALDKMAVFILQSFLKQCPCTFTICNKRRILQ